jgi:hypothetical protein
MGGVMFSGLALNVVDCGFEPQSVQTMTLKFSFKQTAIRRKSKDLLTQHATFLVWQTLPWVPDSLCKLGQMAENRAINNIFVSDM